MATQNKSKQAFRLLHSLFGNECFSFENAQKELKKKFDFDFYVQTLGAMKRAKLIEGEKDRLVLVVDIESNDTNKSTAQSSWLQSHRRKFICETDSTKTGAGDFFTKEDLLIINDCYMSWKQENERYLELGCRRANLPELLTEGLASALLNMPRTNNIEMQNIDKTADLVDVTTGTEIQIKGISTIGNEAGGPTSFGPRTKFARLIAIHVSVDQDKAYFYELDASEYKNWKVNANETIEDQQKAGKRPRLTILPIIKKQGLKPFIIYNYQTGEIE